MCTRVDNYVRQFSAEPITVALVANVPQRIFFGSGNRVALHAGYGSTGGAWDNANSQCVIGPLVNGVIVPLIVLSQQHPYHVVEIGNVGPWLFQEIWAGVTAGNFTFGFTQILHTNPEMDV